MKKLLPLFFFSIFSLSASLTFAQMGMEETGDSQFLTNKQITLSRVPGNVTGSVYENKEFIPGYVFRDGKTLASNVALRYNAKRDEVEVKKTVSTANSQARVLRKNEDLYIKIRNKVFVYAPVTEGNEKAGYFMVLQEGDHYSLYKKIEKEFLEGRESVNSITRDTPPAFKTKEIFYLVNKADGSFAKLPKSRKGKLKLFTDNKKKVKEYINDNRLNINKDYQLIKLVKYYDTL